MSCYRKIKKRKKNYNNIKKVVEYAKKKKKYMNLINKKYIRYI